MDALKTVVTFAAVAGISLPLALVLQRLAIGALLWFVKADSQLAALR